MRPYAKDSRRQCCPRCGLLFTHTKLKRSINEGVLSLLARCGNCRDPAAEIRSKGQSGKCNGRAIVAHLNLVEATLAFLHSARTCCMERWNSEGAADSQSTVSPDRQRQLTSGAPVVIRHLARDTYIAAASACLEPGS
ncbi:hypothetical protein MRX96_050668 [Rhipicephalus microplus]